MVGYTTEEAVILPTVTSTFSLQLADAAFLKPLADACAFSDKGAFPSDKHSGLPGSCHPQQVQRTPPPPSRSVNSQEHATSAEARKVSCISYSPYEAP